MSWEELLGLFSGAFTTLGLIPQVVRLFRMKSAHEISLTFTSLFLVGVAAWLAYGIVEGLLPVILWNAISVVLMSSVLYAKLKYDK